MVTSAFTVGSVADMRANSFLGMRNRSAMQRFAPENNVTKLHASYYTDPAVQEMELNERDRLKDMEMRAQASANRAAASTQAPTAPNYAAGRRRRNRTKSANKVRSALEYLRDI